MIKISKNISIPDAEVEIVPTRAQGPGGQNVNKSATAVHLRFDVQASSLPDGYKSRLMALKDKRMTRDGVIVIKSQQHRSQEDNRREAFRRLYAMIKRATVARKRRKPTRPTVTARNKRMDKKTRRGRLKSLRGKIDAERQ